MTEGVGFGEEDFREGFLLRGLVVGGGGGSSTGGTLLVTPISSQLNARLTFANTSRFSAFLSANRFARCSCVMIRLTKLELLFVILFFGFLGPLPELAVRLKFAPPNFSTIGDERSSFRDPACEEAASLPVEDSSVSPEVRLPPAPVSLVSLLGPGCR